MRSISPTRPEDVQAPPAAATTLRGRPGPRAAVLAVGVLAVLAVATGALPLFEAFFCAATLALYRIVWTNLSESLIPFAAAAFTASVADMLAGRERTNALLLILAAAGFFGGFMGWERKISRARAGLQTHGTRRTMSKGVLVGHVPRRGDAAKASVLRSEHVSRRGAGEGSLAGERGTGSASATSKPAMKADDSKKDVGATSDSSAPGDKPRKARGFAVMDPKLVSELAARGGKAAHAAGTAHTFTSAEARAAGRKGGLAAHEKRRSKPSVAD